MGDILKYLVVGAIGFGGMILGLKHMLTRTPAGMGGMMDGPKWGSVTSSPTGPWWTEEIHPAQGWVFDPKIRPPEPLTNVSSSGKIRFIPRATA